MDIEKMERTLTVSDIIDKRPLGAFQVRTIMLCGLVLVLDGFDAQSIGFLAPSIAKTLQVPVNTFGPVFGAALLGLMLAAMASGPAADRVGRKWPIVISTLMFGTFTLLAAHATSLDELLLFRFLTGLGLGGAMPNVVALASEYSPKRSVSVLVTVLFCGMPLGAFLAGLVGSVMLSRWGWHSVFYVGGILPLALGVVLAGILPESIRFLNVSGADPGKITGIMQRVWPQLGDTRVVLSSHDERPKGIPVKYLFAGGRALGTLLLWISFFMNLLIIYFVVSWLPALLQQVSQPISSGINAILLFSLGGVGGCLAQGRVMNRFGEVMVLGLEFGISAVLIASLAFSPSVPLMMTVAFILGFTIQGSQAGLNAVAAGVYPTAIRSTGVGWALGVGRIGSIVGPVLGGMMLSTGWQPQQIFLAGAIPAVLAALAIVSNSRLLRHTKPYETELDPSAVT